MEHLISDDFKIFSYDDGSMLFVKEDRNLPLSKKEINELINFLQRHLTAQKIMKRIEIAKF